MRLSLTIFLILMVAVITAAQPVAVASGRESAAARVPAAPEDGGPRNWEVTGISNSLNLREGPSAKAAIIFSYPPSTIIDNLGCLHAEGRAWCDILFSSNLDQH